MCLFCEIAKKNIKADIVYENENVIAFKDINPKALVHILLIPKKHISGLTEINETHSEDVLALFEAINKVCEIAKIKDSGFRLIVNSGADGGQEVLHLHFHILGGQKLAFPSL